MKTKTVNTNDHVCNYWMYEDGHTYWGVGLYRFGKLPMKTTKEMHIKTTEEKVAWYLEQTVSKETVVK